MSVVVLGVAVALLATTGLAGAASLRLRSLPELVLAAYLLAFATIVGASLFLSAFGAMTASSLMVATVSVLVAVLGAWLLVGAPRPPSPPRDVWRSLASPAPVTALAVAAGLALAYVVALIAATPPNGWDQLVYHLTRAAFWSQAHEVGYLENAYDERLNFNPPHGEIAFGFVLSLGRHETLTGFVQLTAALACAVGVFALARRIGCTRQEAAFGGLLFFTLPIVLLQSSTTKNDLVVASFLTCAAVFVIRDERRHLGLAALATGLAVGAKFTAAYGLPVLALLALLTTSGRRRLKKLVWIGVGAVLGSYWYLVNALETDRLLGDQSNTPGLTAVLQPRENLLAAYGLAADLIDVSGAQGSDVFLYPLAALPLLAALARRGSGRARAGLLVIAIAAFAPFALRLLSSELTRPGLVKLHELLGEPRAVLGDELGANFLPTTASDTASWYGPTGLFFIAGGAVAGVVFVRRRALPQLALVLALAPLVGLLLGALSLMYHPWQGRFFLFAVACSAALWGLVLRSQTTAWAAVVIAAVTAFISLLHYIEKPSGLRVLERGRSVSVWSLPRWQVQSQHAPEFAPALRFLDEEVPRGGSVALALGANEFGYPAFGPELERRVALVPFGSSATEVRTDWLLANPERAEEVDSTCWDVAFRSETGTIFTRREPDCAG